MKNFIFIISIILITSQLNAQNPEIYCKHFFYGYPTGTPESNDLIIRDIYALSSNDETKFADWVAYRLTVHEVDGSLTIDRAWKSDPWLDEEETLEPKSGSENDYKYANDTLKTDRGHQAPLGSFKNSVYASETNYLSNITPQKSDLNRGPWMYLENKVRDIVRKTNLVYVMTGPLYEREMPKLPNANEQHKLPSGYWKIIIIPTLDDQFNTAAFIFDQNTPRSDNIYDHIVSINEVEERSNLDFLWLLDDNFENQVESKLNKDWIIENFQ
ncbi:MAG: DNA/RNA non-specific endonuclease [Bacteroidetes bacterium]|nr:DNA/RNA non-specific endonuclease [Bacteroidota bacterium]